MRIKKIRTARRDVFYPHSVRLALIEFEDVRVIPSRRCGCCHFEVGGVRGEKSRR